MQERKKKQPQPEPMEVDDRNDGVSSDDETEEELDLSQDQGLFVDGIRIPPAEPPTLSFDPTGPRLIITKIHNYFFKSYAGDQTLGPFHKCFNAIVGPNGSGKSNVIDSLLFVFGYRASKIRCKKVAVLLHDSAQYKNVNTCRVAIHFARIIDKEGDDYDIVPGSEFVIQRTANRDNTSFYEIDGNRAQYKDVALLLKGHGIDLDHNRFLILQGEVEQIATMKCKADRKGESGLLEYLEDIIGTSRFKKPLEQVHERVELLSDRRNERLNRLNIVQEEVEQLRGPMEEAMGYLKEENNVTECKNILYQKSIYNLKAKIEKETEKRQEVAKEEQAFMDKLKVLQEQQTQLTEEMENEAKTYDNLKARCEALREAFNNANKRDVQIEEDMISKNKIRKTYKTQIAEAKKKLLKLKNVPEQNAKIIKELEGKIERGEPEKVELQRQKDILMQNLQNETKDMQDGVFVQERRLDQLREVANKCRAEFNLAQSNLKMCTGDEDEEKNNLKRLQETYETSKATVELRSRQLTELKEKIPSTRATLNKINVELLQFKQEETVIVNNLMLKNAALQDRRSHAQASSSRGRILDSLMRAKLEGKCPGLLGRLGDLGAIDRKYDVAVSTACRALDNIVVETVECAEWCINFLKKHDLGRAVFITLDKQEHLRDRANSRITTPEDVPRLYDLIRIPDERVKTAFYFANRDTLVASTLDQACRIAYGPNRFRVVTLEGDIIETTGTMSGGGKRALRGKMGQSIRTTDTDGDLEKMRALEVEVETIQSRMGELRQKRASFEQRLAELQPELVRMEADLQRFTQELQTKQQELPEIQRKVVEQEKRWKNAKTDADQLQTLTAVLEQKRRELDEANEAVASLEATTNEVKLELKMRTDSKLGPTEKKIQDCTDMMDKCHLEITRLTIEMNRAQRTYEATERKLVSLEQDLKNSEDQLEQFNEERKEIEEDGKKLLTSINEIEEQMKAKEAILSDFKKGIADLSTKQNALKMEMVDVTSKLKDHDKKIGEYEKGVRVLGVKLGQLKLHALADETSTELKDFTEEELETRNAEGVEKELQASEAHLKKCKPNLNAIQDYRKKQEIYNQRARELDEINEKRTQMRNLYDDLRQRRKDEFINGYNIIKMKLKEMYQMITLGGDADLEMVDTFDPFSEGIRFNVRPPRKTWKEISNLSGGEKTLSSLALVFALHYYRPSPLYVMDEIDAALDFKNVSIVANYIKDRTKNAQFIIISLRSNMFELCDHLIGIYKTFDTTKSIAINPRLYEMREVTRALRSPRTSGLFTDEAFPLEGIPRAADRSVASTDDAIPPTP